jgi:hypothetical protein
MKRYVIVALLAALPLDAQAQDDRAYCNRLGSLALRYLGGAGAEGGLASDLNVLGAVQDCNKGRADKSIPYFEKRLRDNHITLPPR